MATNTIDMCIIYILVILKLVSYTSQYYQTTVADESSHWACGWKFAFEELYHFSHFHKKHYLLYILKKFTVCVLNTFLK